MIYIDVLNLNGNRLEGTIPTEIGTLTKLQAIYASFNEYFVGTIPTEIGYLSNTIQYIKIESNDLSGTLPSELGHASKLKILNLANNRISGSIPSEIASLPNLGTFFFLPFLVLYMCHLLLLAKTNFLQ